MKVGKLLRTLVSGWRTHCGSSCI